MAKSARKTITSLSERPQIQTYNFKSHKMGGIIEYDAFRENLLKSQNGRLTARSGQKQHENKFLNSIQSVEQLNQLLNPSGKRIGNNTNIEHYDTLRRDSNFCMNDVQLERTLLKNEDSLSIESFTKYLDIMLNRHLKFNKIEENEIKKRNVDDLDLNNINEHFVSK